MPALPAALSGALCELDDYDLEQFLPLAARYGIENYGFVVTPNADHLIRLDEDPVFAALYAQAQFVLLDSRFVAKLVRLTRGKNFPVCTGSDLTAHLLDAVIAPDDKIVLIGASSEQAAQIAATYNLRQLAHHNPPMGFIHKPEAVEECLRFVEQHSPFRFCFLAVGSPQQEKVAQQLKARGVARGLALCIGASIDFLTGREKRAPQWLQRLGMEWTYRLIQAPGRMAQRYLKRGPRLFGLLLRRELRLRAKTLPNPGADA